MLPLLLPLLSTPSHQVLYCTIYGLYCTVLYYTVLYSTTLHIALYCTVLYYTELYCTVLYRTVLHCILYCTVLYSTVLYHVISCTSDLNYGHNWTVQGITSHPPPPPPPPPPPRNHYGRSSLLSVRLLGSRSQLTKGSHPALFLAKLGSWSVVVRPPM